MDMGEAIAIATGGLAKEADEKCPFKYDESGVGKTESEDIEEDDRDAVRSVQANNGGVLGTNMIGKLPGKDGTVGGPFPPPDLSEDKPQDTKRGEGAPKVSVRGEDGIEDGLFPITVAAHHLIPGKASLAPSEVKKYMTKGDTIESKSKKKWKINSHIGYNVNGCHNGVWLPGNYAIRTATSPTGISWGSMTESNWQRNYVASCAKAAGGQFHDAHTQYSSAVETVLNKIAAVLLAHQELCKDCLKKEEVPPPYFIKQRLYDLSKYFKGQVTSGAYAWKRPWFTSDRWRDDAFSGGKIKSSFLDAYNIAELVKGE